MTVGLAVVHSFEESADRSGIQVASNRHVPVHSSNRRRPFCVARSVCRRPAGDFGWREAYPRVQAELGEKIKFKYHGTISKFLNSKTNHDRLTQRMKISQTDYIKEILEAACFDTHGKRVVWPPTAPDDICSAIFSSPKMITGLHGGQRL